MSSILFPSGSMWWSLVQLWAGGLVGWFLNPTIWLVVGPFRWLAVLTATAAQESGFNASNTSGDDGQSWGMLQFYASTWEAVTGRPGEDRLSPFLQGMYAARYVRLALETDRRWLKLALPFAGFAYFRWLWTRGYAQSSADRMSEAWAYSMTEGRAWPAWIFWRGLWIVPTLILLPALLLPFAWKGRGRR